MIYISFPSNKKNWLQLRYVQLSQSLLGYKTQDMSWWGQLRNNIFTSVNKYYKDISLVPWDSEIPLSGNDILITFYQIKICKNGNAPYQLIIVILMA